MRVCDYCGDQEQIPESCAEDTYRAKEKGIKSKSFGVKVILNCFPVKSYTGSNRTMVKQTLENEFAFCSKDCFVEYIKKNIDEEGEFKYKNKDTK